jgi:hypothetical protein
VANIEEARTAIGRLRLSGEGMNLPSCRGTFWGVLNAITEYVDHHRACKTDRFSYALLGDGSDLKMKAYKIIREISVTAA